MNESSKGSGFLTPLQQRLISVALVVLALLLIGGFAWGVFLLLRGLVVSFAEILWPLAVAGILALLLRPVVLWAERTVRIGRIGAILLLYGLALVVCLALIALILPMLLSQARDFLEYLPTVVDKFTAMILRIAPEAGKWLQTSLSEEALRGHLQSIAEHFRKVLELSLPALNTLGEYVAQVVTWAAGLAIIPVYLFFFLRSDQDPLKAMDEQLSFIPTRVREDITFLIGEFARIIVAFFRGQILIGLIMGVLMALGFSLVGLRFGAFLGVIIGLLNIIPYLGSILGLLTVLPLAFFQQDGGLLLLVLVLAVFVVVQLVESYLLTPKIMGRSTGLHPLAIIVSIFFWGKALSGVLGMVLAIPLTAFFVVAWRLIKRKYLEDHALAA
ncbi:MAG TPA: AI-2E family transporter [Desulfonatronum sp.]|nr:AI-2E family transporter [Desulfonatronum sp.]